MVKLRKLDKRDVFYMLEWMHDSDTKKIFQTDFSKVSENDAIKFIKTSYNDENQHFAVVDDEDEYLGTISLKNINEINKNAEYAISMRKCARGKNISSEATQEILKYGFETLKLSRIYLCVSDSNQRAIRFYKKMGFRYEGCFRKHVFIGQEFHDLLWFSILSDEFVSKV